MIRSSKTLFLPVWFLVALCPVGYCQVPTETEPTAKDEANDSDGWGETVNGLRMRLSAPKSSIVLGEKFRLRIELAVVGESALTVAEPMVEGEIDIQGQRRMGSYVNYNTVIVARALPASRPEDIPNMGIQMSNCEAEKVRFVADSGAPRPVKPGLRLRQELLVFWSMREYAKPLGYEDFVSGKINHNYISVGRTMFLATKAGKYEFLTTYRIDKTNSDLRKKDAWAGELKSKPILLEVTKEEAKPADDKIHSQRE